MAEVKVATIAAQSRNPPPPPPPPPKSLLETVPWMGLASLAAMVVCAAGSAIVVGISRDQIANTWEVQPAVILAIISAASNIAFNSALATAIAVRFWLYASRDALLSQLHYIWDHGRGFGLIAALRAGSEARTVALLATIAYITQFSSSPLLQRSLRQEIQQRDNFQPLYMDLATHIPDGWFGTMENDTVIGFLNGLPPYQGLWRNESMYTRGGGDRGGVGEGGPYYDDDYTCNGGTCYGYVKGVGITHRCSTSQQYINMASEDNNGDIVFSINSTRVVNATGQPHLDVMILYASDVNDSCIATLTIDTCSVDAAIVEYPVTVQNSTITLRHDELTSMRVVSTFTSDLDLVNRPNGSDSGPLGGLGVFVDQEIGGWSRKKFRPKTNRTVYSGPAILADSFLQTQTSAYDDDKGPRRKCALTWSSPTDYALKSMHEFMFRVALRLGQNGTERQTLDSRRVVTVSVFVLDSRYLGAALVTMTCSIVLVASLMWGWWQLRRPVTLSPLETAGALVEAPELRDMPPGHTLRQILTQVSAAEMSSGGGSGSGGGQPRSPRPGKNMSWSTSSIKSPVRSPTMTTMTTTPRGAIAAATTATASGCELGHAPKLAVQRGENGEAAQVQGSPPPDILGVGQ